MSNMIDLYQLLHVQRDAPTAVIKASYRAMMQKLQCHPDLGGDMEVAQQLNRAVETLCNPGKRAEYDKRLALSEAPVQKESVKPKGFKYSCKKYAWKKWKPGTQHTTGQNRSESAAQPDDCQQTPQNAQQSKQKSRQSHSASYQNRKSQGTNSGYQNAADSAQAQTGRARTAQHDSTETRQNKADSQRTSKPNFRSRAKARRNPNHSNALPAKPACPFCKSTLSGKRDAQVTSYSHNPLCTQCRSALTPIHAINPQAGQSIRRIHRQSQSLPVRIWHTWPQAEPGNAVVTDFSPAGCAIDSIDGFSIGQVLKLESALFQAICTVRFSQQTANGLNRFGLEFVTLNLNSNPGTFLALTA